MEKQTAQFNYFELLGLAQNYQLDQGLLTANYRRLQQEFHPDRVATASERERRLVVQRSSMINEAYDTLSSHTRRAAYLLRLAGVDSDMSAQTFSDPVFLMQQIELREELADLSKSADPEADLDVFYRDLAAVMSVQQREFADFYGRELWSEATASYAKLQFLEKLKSEAERKEGELLDY